MLLEAGAMKMDASVDLKSTNAKQVIVETAASVVTPSSSTLLATQKDTSSADKIVSSTVAANMIRALSSVTHTPVASEPSKGPTDVTSAAAVSPPKTSMTAVAKSAKSAKGFYKKPSSVDELCPVEEECDL